MPTAASRILVALAFALSLASAPVAADQGGVPNANSQGDHGRPDDQGNKGNGNENGNNGNGNGGDDNGGDDNGGPACGSLPTDADQVAAARARIDAECDCDGARNHGQYVSCVAHAVNAAVRDGLRNVCRAEVLACAGRSTCGRKGFVTCCRTDMDGNSHCSIRRSADLCRAPIGGSASVGQTASCCDACAGGTTTTTAPETTSTTAPTTTTLETTTTIGTTTTAPTTTTIATTTTLATTTTTEATTTTIATTTTAPTTTTIATTTTAPTTTTIGTTTTLATTTTTEATTTTIASTTTTEATTTTIATTTTLATTTTTEATTTTIATTTTSSTTTTTQPSFTLLRFTTVPGTTSCGAGGLTAPASAPLSGEIDADVTCSTKIDDLGLGCLYFGGGKATIVPPGLIPDGAASNFSITGPGTLGGNAGTGPKDCTNGSGPLKHCVNGWCNSDAQCNGTVGSCAAGLPPGNCAAGTQTSPITCASDADCGGGATSCRPDANCFFGPPLPIPSPPPNDALTTCVQNVVDTTATGTFNAATGDSNVSLPLGSRVYITGNSTDPCPRCISGTCDATWVDVNGSNGEDNGKPCTTDGVVVTTSLQCRPPLSGYQANLPVNLTPLTTGTASKTNTTGQFCPGQTVANVGAFGQPASRCIKETGTAAGDVSDGQPHTSAIAAVFCIPKTGNVAVDGVAALPGPGAIGINGVVQVQ